MRKLHSGSMLFTSQCCHPLAAGRVWLISHNISFSRELSWLTRSCLFWQLCTYSGLRTQTITDSYINRLRVCSNRINLVGQCVVCVFLLLNQTGRKSPIKADFCVGYLFFPILVLPLSQKLSLNLSLEQESPSQVLSLLLNQTPSVHLPSRSRANLLILGCGEGEWHLLQSAEQGVQGSWCSKCLLS